MTYTAPERGYIQVFVANASDQEVFFDQMEVEHIPQLIVQENHYYPFGLELAGLNKKGKPEHRWKFQGQEEQKEFGLNWSSFKWRNADVALGRFFSVDPLAEDYVYNSTYAFSENKVTSHVELEGLESVKKNEQAQITKVVKHGSKALKRLRPKGSGGGAFFPSSTPRSGDAPRNNIFPGNYTLGPRTTRAEREQAGKIGRQLNFNIMNAQVMAHTRQSLSPEEQQYLKELRESSNLSDQEQRDLQWLAALEATAKQGRNIINPKMGDKYQLDGDFLQELDSMTGFVDVGWYTGTTLHVSIPAILKDLRALNGPKNQSVTKKLTAKLEKIAKSLGLTEVIIEFQMVSNTSLKFDPDWAYDLGYTHHYEKNERSGDIVTWENDNIK